MKVITKKTENYSMSFTTAGLLRKESIAAASLFLDLHDWNTVRERVFLDNIFQLRTQNSIKRIFSEIRSRLELLTIDEMSLLSCGAHQDEGYLLWLALCRRYKFIAEFAQEIMREKFLSMRYQMEPADFNIFLEQKAVTHEGLLTIADSTRNRLRQMLFQFMRESGITDKQDRILTAFFSNSFVLLLRKNRCIDAVFFPAANLGKI